ncbi:MAG: hypothetical protein U0Q55_18515 [Vicinamibacterales bacterium]
MRPGDFFDFVPLARTQLRVTTAFDLVLGAGCLGIIAAWLTGHPLFYTTTSPVMSPFTALSLLLMVLTRQLRLHVETWPMVLSLAMTGLVLGGNASSIVMLAATPPDIWATFPDLVLTSVMTSVGLVLFCAYDLVIELRDTPRQAFIMDDMLIHLALVPGGLSLLGYLLGNPTYLSMHADPRVGISPPEMICMGLYAVAAVCSNPRLFLWQFLSAGLSNRIVFGLLFLNQFVAPLFVAIFLTNPGAQGPGIELFVMLAGVVATLSFLLVQARVSRRGALSEQTVKV